MNPRIKKPTLERTTTMLKKINSFTKMGWAGIKYSDPNLSLIPLFFRSRVMGLILACTNKLDLSQQPLRSYLLVFSEQPEKLAQVNVTEG